MVGLDGNNRIDAGLEILLYALLSGTASQRYFHVDNLVGNLQGINDVIIFIELCAYRIDSAYVVLRYRRSLVQHV